MPKRFTSSMSLMPKPGQEEATRQLFAQSAREALADSSDKQMDVSLRASGNVLTIDCTGEPHVFLNRQCRDVLLAALDQMQKQFESMKLNEVKSLEQSRKKLLQGIRQKHESDWPAVLDNAEAFDSLEEAFDNSRTLSAHWMDAIQPDRVTQELAKEFGRIVLQIDQTRNELVSLQAREKSLGDWINSPKNKTIEVKVKRVVHFEDTPELIRLKDRKAEIEASRMQLLQRATSAHPLARKMAAQIDELNAQINALTRLPQTVEDSEKRSNPELPKWHRGLADIRSEIVSKQALVQTLVQQGKSQIAAMRKSWKKFIEADTQNKADVLKKKLTQADIPVSVDKQLPYTVYQQPSEPVALQHIDPLMAYLVGGGIGVFAAVLLLIGRRNMNLEISEKKPDYPLLGRIPHLGQSGTGTGGEDNG